MSKVFIDNVGSNPYETLQRGLDFIDWGKYINKGSRVFIKPNFTYPYYKEGVTTNPETIRNMLKLIRQKTDNIRLGESDGGYHIFKAEHAFEGHNMYQICKEFDVELINLSNLPSEMVSGEILGRKVEVLLPRLLLEDVDCFISISIFKMHAMTTLSLSLKNLWGCFPDPGMRVLWHKNLGYKFALIASLLKPKIVVIDGNTALDEHGPMFGKPVNLGVTLVSDNTLAADKIASQIMGFSPAKIDYIAVAERAGLDPSNNIEINKDWKQYRRQFHLKKTIVDRINRLLTFNNPTMAKFIYNSAFTPMIYKVVNILRTRQEHAVVADTSKKYKGVKNY